MTETVLLAFGILVLSIVSGMLGLGVAFAAVPFLSLFMTDLVNEVQPLGLLMNGVTAAFAAWGFAKSGLIDWRKALTLAAVTTTFAPLGSWLAQSTPATLTWVVYLLAVAYLAYRLFRPVKERPGSEDFRLALVLAAPISVLSGLLGVGPGFLLMPTLVRLGYTARIAAATNSVIVTLPSFSAFASHLGKIRRSRTRRSWRASSAAGRSRTSSIPRPRRYCARPANNWMASRNCATTAPPPAVAGSSPERGRRKATSWRGATTRTRPVSATHSTGRLPGRPTGACCTTVRPATRAANPGRRSAS